MFGKIKKIKLVVYPNEVKDEKEFAKLINKGYDVFAKHGCYVELKMNRKTYIKGDKDECKDKV